MNQNNIPNPYKVIQAKDTTHGYCKKCCGFYAIFDDLCADCYLEENVQKYLDSLKENSLKLRANGLTKKKKENIEKRLTKGWVKFNLRTFNID